MASLKVPSNVPLPEDDAEQLHKAFSGWGTNEKLIISILAHRNATQRSLIRSVYAATYNEDLLKALDKELSSEFERAVMLWTLDPAERDAYLAKESTKMFTKNNWVLVEIACTRPALELFKVKQAYQARYKKSLEEDVAQHTSGDLRKLLLPLVSTFRYEGDDVNMMLARSEAKILHEKVSEKAYSDDDFIRILTTRSKAQLGATLNHYNNEYGNAINKNLKEESDNEYLKLLRAVITCLTYPEKHFENKSLLCLELNLIEVCIVLQLKVFALSQFVDDDWTNVEVMVSKDRICGRFENSAGKEVDLVSSASQAADAIVFLPSDDESTLVTKVFRQVSLVRYPEPKELLETMKAKTRQKLVGAATGSSGKNSDPTRSSRHKSGQSVRQSASTRSSRQKSMFSAHTETPKSSKRKHSESSSGKHWSSTSTVSGYSERSGKSKKKLKKEEKQLQVFFQLHLHHRTQSNLPLMLSCLLEAVL